MPTHEDEIPPAPPSPEEKAESIQEATASEEESDDALLPTKIQPPRPRFPLVQRPHLLRLLELGMQGKLTLLSAPAGSGKTTLLSDWLISSQKGVAWLSLEATENEPISFFTYVLAALQQLDPQFGRKTASYLRSFQPFSSERLMTMLIHDIMTSSLLPCVLVLDDYHLITSDAIHRALIFLLDHMPEQLHLIVTTRIDPPFPLMRLRAQGQLIELRAADLQFTKEEVGSFLRSVMGLDLDVDAVTALEQRTEGWIAGIQLAALSLRHRPDSSAFLQSFSGSHRFVLDYLSEEVLSQQEADVQAFLCETAILTRLCGPLCDAVTERQGGQGMLDWLEQANLFVCALDLQRQWYRYHPLFADVLRNRLQQTQPDRLTILHQRASRWYEQHGVFPEAIRHALEAQDFERAARLLEEQGFEVVLHGQIKTALDWVGLLPEPLVRARPLLCVLHASALVLSNRVKEAEARLDQAEQKLRMIADQQTSQRILGQIVLLRGVLALSIGDAMHSCMLARQALELLPEADTWWYQVARTHAARAYLLEGDATPVALRRVRETLEALSRSGDLVHTVACLLFLARLQQLQGHLREAVQTYRRVEQALSDRSSVDDMASASAYYFGLGEILYEWNRLEEAEQRFRQGVELDHSVSMVDARNVVQCSLGLARLLQARGDAAQALAILDDLLQLARHSDLIPYLIQRVAAVRAHIALAQGDGASALRWAEEVGLSVSDADLSYMREREYLTLARVLIVRGREERGGSCLHEALHLLDRLLQEARARERKHSSIEILVLCALALHAQGDLEQALVTVQQALEWGEPEGYVRVFADEGLSMTHLLLQLGEVFQQKVYVQTLLAVCAPIRQEAEEQPFSRALPLATPSVLIEPLTERELEVLRLLAAGASNKAIAEQLVIEVSTAKRHVSNIFAKLMVTNRTLAVAKAREYGVLS